MMRRTLLLIITGCLAAMVRLDAQTVTADRFRLNTGPCFERSGSGSPEGAQLGNPCDTYKDISPTGGGKYYWKVSGVGTTTGWMTWTPANTANALVSRDGSGGITVGPFAASTGAFSSALTGTTGTFSGALVAASGRFTANTPGRVVFATTGGLLTDDPDFTFSGDTVTATKAITPTSLTTPFVFGYGAPPTLSLGGSGLGCTGYPVCESTEWTFDTSLIRQRLRTDTNYQSHWNVSTTGANLNAFNGGGWMPLRLWGGPTTVQGGGFHVGSTSILDPGLGNSALDGYIGSPTYASQTIGWRIDGLGAADFRYVYTDELHARKFIADLEQALAGLQIIAKSVGQVGLPFAVPAPGSIGTLVMKDLPSAENMAIYEAGDYIWLRTFNRHDGQLDITDAFGTVASYVDLPDGFQQWQFTRLLVDGGAMAAGTVVSVDSISLDVGVPGNGWTMQNAIDGPHGINSPYFQVVTWSGNSPISANQTVRARLGNLRGITGVTEHGLLAGTFGAGAAGHYFIASDQRFEIVGMPFSMYNGASQRVLFIDHQTPSFAMGTPAPASYTTGTGEWSGIDGGVYKWRVGNFAGQYISFDSGSGQLTVNGNIVVTGTSVDAATVTGVPGATVVSGAARGLLGVDAQGNPILHPFATANTPPGNGLFLGSTQLGFYNAGAWRTYMDSAGRFYLTGPGSNGLSWDGTSLTVTGVINVTSGNAAKTDLTNVTGHYAGSPGVGGAANSIVNQGALATVSAVNWASQVAGIPLQLTDARITNALDGNGALRNLLPAVPTGAAGLFLGSDYMGYHDGVNWRMYMDNLGNFASGASSFTTGVGYWLAFNSGTPQFRIGNPAGNRLSWDGSNLYINGSGSFTGDVTATSGSFTGAVTATSGSFTGTVTATSGSFTGTVHAASGDIGGWTVNPTNLVKDTTVNATSSGQSPTDYPFYAGATYASRATAPFRVTPAGVVTASGLTVQTAGTSNVLTLIGSGTTASIALDSVNGLQYNSPIAGLSAFQVTPGGAWVNQTAIGGGTTGLCMNNGGTVARCTGGTSWAFDNITVSGTTTLTFISIPAAAGGGVQHLCVDNAGSVILC